MYLLRLEVKLFLLLKRTSIIVAYLIYFEVELVIIKTGLNVRAESEMNVDRICLLYTSDAADE